MNPFLAIQNVLDSLFSWSPTLYALLVIIVIALEGLLLVTIFNLVKDVLSSGSADPE